jgi:hypothetical protein
MPPMHASSFFSYLNPRLRQTDLHCQFLSVNGKVLSEHEKEKRKRKIDK